MGNLISKLENGAGEHFSVIPTTETTLILLRTYFERYRTYLKSNPILVSEIESALYWISYLFASTRFHNSRIISELLYSCSSLLTLFNDNLLRKSYNLKQSSKPAIHQLHTVLTFIDYLQIFLEISATHLYGQVGKWIVVSLIELFKATIRLVLLFHFQQGLTRRNYLQPLNRPKEFELFKLKAMKQCSKHEDSSIEEIIETQPKSLQTRDSDETDEGLGNSTRANSVDGPERGEDKKDEDYHEQLDDVTFKLASSGRVLRTIELAPTKSERMWLTPVQTIRLRKLVQKHNAVSPEITQLNRVRLIGELIHILRPLAHLTTSASVGSLNHWSPYMVSFVLDVVSLRFLANRTDTFFDLSPWAARGEQGKLLMSINNKNQLEQCWNWAEEAEVQRRYISLLMYLLRSPFYDRFTKERLLKVLSFIANYVPLIGRLVAPLVVMLPQWQQSYFYTWSC